MLTLTYICYSSSCYFVMDLLTGADLRYYIKKRIILTEPELAFIVGCISSALHHIHTKHVLHRDVKVSYSHKPCSCLF